MKTRLRLFRSKVLAAGPGTGCVAQISENLWEERYNPKWPDRKKHARNIYAHSLEECEEKLAKIILEQVKAEIAATKGYPSLLP